MAFEYVEGITRRVKEFLLDGGLAPSFSATLAAVNDSWGDNLALAPLTPDRIHRAMPRRLLFDATDNDMPALFISPQEAAEAQPRPLGRNVWRGSYEVFLTYCDTDRTDDLLARRMWRWSQALAEFFRKHSTLGGYVQSCLVVGFIYAPILFPADSNFADVTVRLQIVRQESE